MSDSLRHHLMLAHIEQTNTREQIEWLLVAIGTNGQAYYQIIHMSTFMVHMYGAFKSITYIGEHQLCE